VVGADAGRSLVPVVSRTVVSGASPATGGEGVPRAGVLIARSASTITWLAVAGRSSASLAMPRAMTSSSAGGSSGRRSVTSGGGFLMCA
jgi:hypothetical protein